MKCDFFYPMSVKDPVNLPDAYHIIQAKQDYSSLNLGAPAYTFGKNTHRDQNSHMKDIIRVLNERKGEIDRAKKERMRIHTIG